MPVGRPNTQKAIDFLTDCRIIVTTGNALGNSHGLAHETGYWAAGFERSGLPGAFLSQHEEMPLCGRLVNTELRVCIC